MWGADLVRRWSDCVELCGLCDINSKRVAVARKRIGADCPTYTDFEAMCDRVEPELLVVTTVDAFHHQYITRGLERGMDVITEKPMVIDERQCQAVLDAERRSKGKLIVAHNYRYAPKHQKMKEVLASGAIGDVLSVDFHWYLDTSHGADYFRRWHRRKDRSGSLLVHKASHHFDLLNWWMGAEPIEIEALGALRYYGKNGAFRHTNCRPCPHQDKCRFYFDMTRDAGMMELYAACESEDQYLRDGCVYRDDVDIYDTMSVMGRYSNGASLSYSLNAFMPFEGYRIAFNGTAGRFEVRDYERQPWDVAEPTEMFLTHNFGAHEKVAVPVVAGDHGGGDDILRDVIFGKRAAPPHLALPDSRAGAMACLTGIAARKSIDEGRRVSIDSLVKFG
ncbi:MAG: Gfo/Idh/MocA family oxidoreductase [Planctomycetota bacterium]